MRKIPRRLLDLALAVVGLAIVTALLLAPPVATPQLPTDQNHRPLLHTAVRQGKKKAEASCRSCHNPEQVPFPPDHPDGQRCLFCHRLPAEPVVSRP